MKYIRAHWDGFTLLLLTWCILNEDFTLSTVISGIIAAILTIMVIRMLFSKNDDIKNYRIRPYLLLWFIIVLFFHIIKASIETIRGMIYHNINPTVVELKTTIHNHWFQCLVANSITLTPGTITIDKTDHKLRVLWLYPTTEDKEEQEAIIFGAFQNVLKRGDFRR